MALKDVTDYLRLEKLPHIWCPGCGDGIVMQAILRSIKKLNLDQDKVAIVSGIGCSARAAGYMDFNTLHTTHGRALTFATGVKRARPDMTVIVITGDGDCAAIGGNHFIHAARRNIDLTTIVFNNNNYGLTGGQYSPTTKIADITATSSASFSVSASKTNFLSSNSINITPQAAYARITIRDGATMAFSGSVALPVYSRFWKRLMWRRMSSPLLTFNITVILIHPHFILIA